MYDVCASQLQSQDEHVSRRKGRPLRGVVGTEQKNSSSRRLMLAQVLSQCKSMRRGSGTKCVHHRDYCAN